MRNAADKIRKLEAHAKSARKIGNAAEADAFQAKASALRAKHSARAGRVPSYHVHVGRVGSDGFGFEFMMTAFNSDGIDEALQELSRQLASLRDEYRATTPSPGRRRA